MLGVLEKKEKLDRGGEDLTGRRKADRPPVGGPDTRAAIIDAAQDLFAEYGFDKPAPGPSLPAPVSTSP